MKSRATRCLSCLTDRFCIKARGWCKRCYRWQRQLEQDRNNLEAVRADPRKCCEHDPGRLLRRIRRAERVIEEYRWREETLLQDEVSVGRLRLLIQQIARDARSAVGLEISLQLETADGRSRRALFAALLPIVENWPHTHPSLRCNEVTQRRLYYYGGWSDFDIQERQSARWRAEMAESSRLWAQCRALEQAACGVRRQQEKARHVADQVKSAPAIPDYRFVDPRDYENNPITC